MIVHSFYPYETYLYRMREGIDFGFIVKLKYAERSSNNRFTQI